MISNIRLQNFRSYKDESFEFEPAVNIVIGPNASGKTNLLEAVLVLAAGSSYRARDVELVRHKAPWAKLEGFLGKQRRIVKLQLGEVYVEKTFEIDEKPFRRLNLDRTVPIVFFEPNHLQLVSRGPEYRREYLDSLLERTQPAFKATAASYRRALTQRNALLKRGQSFGKSQLFAWNVRLSELGGSIAEARYSLVKDINKTISKTYSSIAGKRSKVEVSYEAQFPMDRYASRMLSKLEQSTQQDYERGFTAAGPHREDVAFHLGSQLVSQTASRGETRSLVLALKVFELGMITKIREQKPILLLDDVFSELDGARRHALIDYLNGYQTIITTTDAEAVLEHFSDQHSLISLGAMVE